MILISFPGTVVCSDLLLCSHIDPQLSFVTILIGSRKTAARHVPILQGSGAVRSRHDSLFRTHMAEAELARLATGHATQLQEMEQTIWRPDQMRNQADQRVKVAEEKAIAAVTVIDMVKIFEQKKIMLNNRDGEKNVHGRPRGQGLRGVPTRGGDVLVCSGTRLIGETVAGMGCRLPRSGDREE